MKFNKITTFFAAMCLALGGTSCSDDDNTPIAVSSVTMSETEIVLEAGQDSTLKVTILPESAAAAEVVWRSDDSSVASVDKDGKVTAHEAGQAVITAYAGSKSCTCTVLVMTPLPTTAPAVGDYYYSDGTWSTEIDPTKRVIGVVFWAGDPTASDAALAREHPGCTHGIVLGLDQERSAWQTGYEQLGKGIREWFAENPGEYDVPASSKGESDPIQKICGYNNTKAIEQFNAAEENAAWPVEAVDWVVNYRETEKAPATSSDWYLPSPKELSLLCAGEINGTIVIRTPVMDNIKFINSRILAIGFEPVAPKSYWASTENFDPNRPIMWLTAWNYYFNDDMSTPLSGSIKDWDESAFVRAVLAF